MQLDITHLRGAFFEEAAEHVIKLESGLLRLEQSPHDTELLDEIFRSAHSIKGGSAIFSFDELMEFTHVLEGVLGRVRDNILQPSRPVIDLLLRASDMTKALLAAAKLETDAPTGFATLQEELAELRMSSKSGYAAVTQPVTPANHETVLLRQAEYRIAFTPGEGVLRLGLNPLSVLEDLATIGTVVDTQADISRVPDLRALEPKNCFLSWVVRLRTDRTPDELRDVFAFFEDDSEISIEPVERQALPLADRVPDKTPPLVNVRGAREDDLSLVDLEPITTAASAATGPVMALESSSIRVPIEKANKLIDLVGELIISQSMITQMLTNFSIEHLSQLQDAVTEMARNTRELQENVMAVRMLPIGTIFHRFPRMVRDLSRTFGKHISLHVSGEETELDKSVIERLSDPLTHLIRNAVDHGIESPEQRHQTGKPEQGTIHIAAYHQGGSVIVDVSDDGGGLDSQKIRQRAVERGIITGNEELTPDQIHTLIFSPGLSTAQEVNAISGRGVGLDVVKRNVEAANGSVSVSSTAGHGTRFRLKLPLTLAILDGLLLRVGSQTYILPLTTIVESLRPQPEQVKTVLGQGELVVLRGAFLPLLRLHQLLNISADTTNPSEGLVVILEYEGRLAALLVDEVLGQQQVVIKSLEANFRKMDGIAGATILGDGHVGLILDVAGLVTMARPTVDGRVASAIDITM